MKELEKILKEGFKEIKKFGEYKMYELKDERLLYDEKTDKIAIRYKFDDDVRLCGSN